MSRKLSSIIITVLVIIMLSFSSSNASTENKGGKGLLNYTDVVLSSTTGNKLKITIKNQEKVNVNKVLISGTKKELKVNNEKNKKDAYVEYNGDTGVINLKFYKKGEKKPFTTKSIEVKKEAKTSKYSANLSPTIQYGKLDDNTQKLIITEDLSKISEIVICKRNEKGQYDYNNNVIYKFTTGDGNFVNTNYINLAETLSNGKKAQIKIKRKSEYEYYEVKVTDNSEKKLTHRREIKVANIQKSPESVAKAENDFSPIVRTNKKNSDKITFTVKKSDKVTNAQIFAIENGKIAQKDAGIKDIKKSDGYITSFSFAKEGMYRLKLSNGKQDYFADYIISKKKDLNTWKINTSPRVTKYKESKEYQYIKVKDGNIKSIKIFIKENGKYDTKKPIYTYENGKVVSKQDKYIGKTTSETKNKKDKYIQLKRLSNNQRYMIQVTDNGESNKNIQLTRTKYVLVNKK